MPQHTSDRVEMVVDIYESIDGDVGHDPTTKKETDTRPHIEAQYSGGDIARSRHSRLTAVCVILTCVLLLTAIMVLWFKYNNLNTKYIQLQTRYNNLTKDRDQLQTNCTTLTKDRDQVQESDGCLRSHDLRIFKSSLYWMSNETKSWTKSRQDCLNKGADLVIIDSKEEQDFISKLPGKSEAWIGLNDLHEENNWKWVDGKPLTTVYWSHGEPNNKDDEDCAVIFNYSNKYFWNDNKCSDERHWICELRVTR